MFAIPGICLLLVFIYVKPQEYPFLRALQAWPLLYIFFALAIFGFALDLRLRRARPLVAPQVGWVLAFFGWALITLLVHAPGKFGNEALDLGISIVLFFVIAHAVQTFRALQLLFGVLLAVVLYLSILGVHQGTQPFGCFVVDQSNPGDLSTGKYDGRSCNNDSGDCHLNDPEPGADYLCEHIGLFGTSSIGGGRVRYLGVLQDPNELSLAIGIGMPFAFAFFTRRRSALRGVLVAITVLSVAVCTIFTQSRGGQLVFIAVMGVYFIRRFGWRGVGLGALVAVPLLLLGGREGEEAGSSTLERIECWYEGISMIKAYPFFGVGKGQFAEHHYLTAHNSYLLSASELGMIGMFLWSMVIYVTVKIPVAILRYFKSTAENELARTWAMAMLASLCGLLVGIFFLSFSYHQVLWVYIGLSAALYAACKTHAPDFRVRVGLSELLGVAATDVALIVALFVYTRVKVG